MQRVNLYLAILLGLSSYFIYFGFLDTWPMTVWDEARVATNSLEMLVHRSFLVVLFDGKPDLWNTKPPLLHWFQIFFMATMGPSDLAVRLPSALSAAATGGSLVYFGNKHLASRTHGLIAALVLAGSTGFVAYHTARTADYDAMLALWTTVYILSFFGYCQTGSKRSGWLFFIAFTCAVLTKGVAGVIAAPILALWALATGHAANLLRKPSFFIGCTVALGVPSLFYYSREMIASGYLQAVFQNDLGGRFLEISEGNTGPWLYYLDVFNGEHYAKLLWLWPSIIGYCIWIFFERRTWRTSAGLYLMVVSVWYFCVLSSSSTKLFWYINPLYPLLAAGAAYPLKLVVEKLLEGALSPSIAFAIAALLVLPPIFSNLEYTVRPEGRAEWEPIQGRFYQATAKTINDQIKNNALPAITHVLFYLPSAHLTWYKNLAAQQGKQIYIYDAHGPLLAKAPLANCQIVTVDTSFIPELRKLNTAKLLRMDYGSAVFAVNKL
jgi:4-amino-4-deoxy-L-arabinose transferase-like glycosyltransferase